MFKPKFRIMSLAVVQRALDAGLPVMLVPMHRPLQKPTANLVVVPVSHARPLNDPNQLQLDVIGPDSILLIESTDWDGQHG